MAQKMTKPRQAVLDVLLKAKRAMGAYDIMRAITPQPNPPTVYRALEFLQQENYIHRISGINAYVACQHQHDCCGGHAAQFAVCDKCGDVQEIGHHHSMPSSGNLGGFNPTHSITEIHGSCARCS